MNFSDCRDTPWQYHFRC